MTYKAVIIPQPIITPLPPAIYRNWIYWLHLGDV